MKNKLLSSIKNKMLQKLLVMSMLCIAYTLPSMSQSILEDTIWYRPLSYDVKSVKFLNNDKYIIVNGEHIFNTQNGEEILFLKSGASSRITLFENDEYFIRMDKPSYKYFIYKTDGFQLIDSLESDPYPAYSKVGRITKDNNFFVSVANSNNNLVVWDLKSKKIVSKANNKDTTLKNNIGISEIAFSADNSKIFVQLTKSYYKGEDPKHNPITERTSNIIIFDAQTLDSIGAIYDVMSFRISKDRKLMAINGYQKKDVVAILDLETMKVKQTINIDLVPTSEITFSDDNKYLVTTGEQGQYTLNFWDLENAKKIYFYNSGIDGFDISKDNSKLITFGGNELLLLKTHLKVNDIINPVSNQTTIYPNPVNQKATVEFTSRQRNVEYTIVNQIGKIVKKSLFMANTDTINKLEIDFSIYPSGIYFVTLFTGETIPQTIKIVKE